MGTSKARALPSKPSSDTGYIEIIPFDTGRMETPAATLVADAKGDSMATSWRFLLRHKGKNISFWFDMGISHDLTIYPPAVQKIHAHFKPLPSTTSIEQDTISQEIVPASIKHVFVSHAHWDHIQPLPASFSGCNMIVGPGSTAHCSESYPKAPDSKFDGRIWDFSIRKFSLVELPPTSSTQIWKPLGPFPHTHDFFGDGSFYLIDAPGHMDGNLAALVRVKTRSGSWKWVILGGDCAHCNLYTYWPDAPFGKMPKAIFPSGTLHECVETARETIFRIAECKRNEGSGVFVWYAHGEFLEGLWEL